MIIRKNISIILLFLSFLTGCKDVIVSPPEVNFNVQDFEAAWLRIDAVYPYLQFKNINWDSIYTVYRPRAENAKGDEFYLVLWDLLAELKDCHVCYFTEGGAEVYPFYPRRHFKDRHAYSPFVVRTYFDRELRLTASHSVEYGIFPQNIGHAFLADFSENYLEQEFAGVMDYLKDIKGLILDIRQKRGGNMLNIRVVVSRFLTDTLPRNDSYYLGEKWELPPFEPQGDFQYTKPVVVLINGSIFSAGEFITEVLKQLPQVTAVGDTTGGGSVGGEDGYFLPSGKSIYTGYIDFRRYDGLPWEWLGVPPDIRVA